MNKQKWDWWYADRKWESIYIAQGGHANPIRSFNLPIKDGEGTAQLLKDFCIDATQNNLTLEQINAKLIALRLLGPSK